MTRGTFLAAIALAVLLAGCTQGADTAARPTSTPVPVTATPLPPTDTPSPTALPPTATPVPATDTPSPTALPPTATPLPPTPTSLPATATPQEQDGSRGTVLMLFGYRFYAWHYKDVRRGLEGAGYDVVVASDQLGPVIGLLSIAPNKTTELMADLVLEEVQVADYDALVLITDYGLSTGDYPLAYQIVRDAVQQGKVVAAYDFAPLLLGQAGVLKGVKATAHMSSHNVCTSLEGSYQAICTNRSVERDGKIVTADGATCSWGCFVRAIEEALQE